MTTGMGSPQGPSSPGQTLESLTPRAPGEGNRTMEKKRYVESISATKPQGEGCQESRDDQSYRHDLGQSLSLGLGLTIYLVG